MTFETGLEEIALENLQAANSNWRKDDDKDTLIRQQQELLREVYKSVLVYYQNYMMDEADSAENCVCGEKQHKDAMAVADVLVKIKTALGDV